MSATHLLTGPAAQAIGWALLHLLWQATIVAALLAATLALIPRARAGARYAVAIGALSLVFALFAATAIRAFDAEALPIPLAAEPESPVVREVPLTRVPVVIAATAAAAWRDRAVDAVISARQTLPTVVALWFLGVIVLSSRLGVSWLRARRLMAYDAIEAGDEWQRACARMAAALGLRRVIRLLESTAVHVPSVIGALRPVILLPASTLTGLTPQQIDMVLAHELAHIRRHDFLVNLLQACAETLMFHHPAVWWISHTVRVEREHCCDDLALSVSGDRVQYARALARLEELRPERFAVAVAANGGSLLERIRRIAGGRAESTSLTSRWVAAVAMLTIIAIAVAVPTLPALAQKEPATTPAATSIVVNAQDLGEDEEALEAALEGSEDAIEAAEASLEESMAATRLALETLDGVDLDAALAPLDDLDVDVEIEVDVNLDLDHLDEHDFVDFHPEVPEPPDPLSPQAPREPLDALYPAPPAPPAPGRVNATMVPRAPHPPSLHIADHHQSIAESRRERKVESHRERKAGSRRERKQERTEVDEIIELRALGVTPEYVQSTRVLFPSASLHDIAQLRAVKVSPEYVRELRAAGLAIPTARDAVHLKAVGVHADFVQAMRAEGFDANIRELTSLKAVGVTPAYLKELRDAGVTIHSGRDATTLRAVGVTAVFVQKLAAAGYKDLSVRELTRLAAVGVDDDFIRDMEQYRTRN